MTPLELIGEVYGRKRAKRSGVLWLNHIFEGWAILDHLDASQNAIDAFIIHPVFQEDDGLRSVLRRNSQAMNDIPRRVICLAMEYRNVANRGLCCYQADNPAEIYLGPLPEVHQMLIADKVQNRKDFLRYHLDTHPKSIELDRYFRNWLRALDVTEAQYEELAAIADDVDCDDMADQLLGKEN